MLLPDMTPGTRRALAAAVAWAQARSEQIDATHALLGLLTEEEGRPVQLFLEQGLKADVIRNSLDIVPVPLNIAEELPSHLDAYLQGLLYEARLHALELTGYGTVSSEHLLLALLEESAQLLSRLEKLGFTIEHLRNKLNAELGPPLQLDEPIRFADSIESMSLARILDANANRAREALRILEELARFHLNDRFLTGLAKELRHALTQAILQYLPNSGLHQARDTEEDVGTKLSTSAESYRPSLRAVLQANAQRLQESLRSLEEYGKVQSPDFGSAIEKIRYRSYSLERALVVGQNARERLQHAQLYLLVSKGSCAASVEWTIREAVAGGVSIVQLREKNKTDRQLLEIAKEIRQVTREAGALFIMNDRPDLARLVEADGVHLGQDDLRVNSARKILGPDALIGVSTHEPKQLEQALLDAVDYVGIGPTFASKTKNFTGFSGLDYLRHVAATTTLPAFAIGGITPKNIHQVVEAGIRRVAVGEAICQADDPQEVARQVMVALQKH